jgi:hypothetical protein
MGWMTRVRLLARAQIFLFPICPDQLSRQQILGAFSHQPKQPGNEVTTYNYTAPRLTINGARSSYIFTTLCLIKLGHNFIF